MHTMNTFDIQFVYKRNNAVEPVDLSGLWGRNKKYCLTLRPLIK